MIVGYELRGDEEVLVRFANLGSGLRAILTEKMAGQMEVLRSAAKRNLEEYADSTRENHGPSGQLSRSLQTSVTEEGSAVIGRVFSDGSVPYASVQEFGGGAGASILPHGNYPLRFIYQGEDWAVNAVTRGETPAKRYLRNALEDQSQSIATALASA